MTVNRGWEVIEQFVDQGIGFFSNLHLRSVNGKLLLHSERNDFLVSNLKILKRRQIYRATGKRHEWMVLLTSHIDLDRSFGSTGTCCPTFDGYLGLCCYLSVSRDPGPLGKRFPGFRNWESLGRREPVPGAAAGSPLGGEAGAVDGPWSFWPRLLPTTNVTSVLWRKMRSCSSDGCSELYIRNFEGQSWLFGSAYYNCYCRQSFSI